MAARIDHRALRQVHFDTAKEELHRHQSARRLAVLPSTIREARAPRQAVRHRSRTLEDASRSAQSLVRWSRRTRRTPAAPEPLCTGMAEACSSQASQLAAQLPCRAEKRILHRFFRRAQRVADGSQFQSLIVLQFENHALARRKPFHGRSDASLNLFAKQLPLGIERRAVFALALKEIRDAFLMIPGVRFGRLIFWAGLTSSELIEADVGDDAVEPGVKAAFETKTVEIAVNLEERLLVNVARVFRALHQI